LIKRILCLVCCIALVLSLTACATESGSLVYTEVESSNIPNGNLIAENSKYNFILDKTNMGLILTDKITGEQWSTTPIGISEEQLDECKEYAVDEIFCCGYAPLFWQAIKIRYPEYCM